ncbi:MAG: amidohydrolase family protein [Acidobacteriia bacterium]|nr:amidohydrolase family protein [Terriglobia bacterium]
MNSYLALIQINLRLAMREKNVLFFNYIFPLIFLFGFGQFIGSRSPAAMTRIVSMVLVIGILGSGLFGAGIRTVVERETGVLRRYKVAPITPTPILVASIITGWLLYLPSAVLIIVLSNVVYKMPLPERLLPLFLLVTLGCFAFRAIGLIIASVANSVAESNVLVQVLYMPMLFMSGATIPISNMPVWAQITAQFLPAAYLNTGVQHVMLHAGGLGESLGSMGALLASAIIGTLVSVKIFRWEKEERIKGSAKAWVVGVFAPFLLLGGYEAYTRDHIAQSKQLDREIRRSLTRLIRGAHIIIGDGRVIRTGSILIRNGKIEKIWDGPAPEAESLRADAVEAAGKTILPGLIDVHVHLGAPGGSLTKMDGYDVKASSQRALAAYLYSGVTAVNSAGDFTTQLLEVRKDQLSGAKLGAELFAAGPLFTTQGGHGTEYFKNAPDFLKNMGEEEFIRTPQNAAQAKEMVHALREQGVNSIKAVLETGVAGMLFQRMDVSLLRAIGEQARKEGLPMLVHTGNGNDVLDAVSAGASGVEHGSARDLIADSTLTLLRERGVRYDPTLSVLEAARQVATRKPELLSRSMVEQVAPPGMIEATRKAFESPPPAGWREKAAALMGQRDFAAENLVRAWKAGVVLVTGSDAGNMLVIHGPTVHRELQLWVAAGIPQAVAIQAATHNAAKLLGAGGRVGLIKEGYEATLLLVDGNPLQDITSTERISSIFFKGERVDRQGLFDQK